MRISKEKLGANIRAMREARGMSMEELEERMYATKDYVCKAEAGKRIVTVKALMAFCDALDTNPNELLEGVCAEE